MKYIKLFFSYLRIHKHVRYIVKSLKQGTYVSFTNPRGKGDYTLYFSSIINYASIHQDRNICMFVSSNRVDVMNCYSFNKNISPHLITLKGLDFDCLAKKIKKLQLKYKNILFVDFIPQDEEIYSNYQSVFDVIWNKFFLEKGTVKPIPCKPSLVDEESALSFKKEQGPYILINASTPSINIPDSNSFFISLLSEIKNRYKVKVISNNIQLDGVDLVLNCSFEKLYGYFKNALVEIGIRSGLEDFCIGCKTPIISIIPKEENYMSVFSNLLNWKTGGFIKNIKFDQQEDNIKKVIAAFEEVPNISKYLDKR